MLCCGHLIAVVFDHESWTGSTSDWDKAMFRAVVLMETQNAYSQKSGANMSLLDVVAAEFKAMCATGNVDDQCLT